MKRAPWWSLEYVLPWLVGLTVLTGGVIAALIVGEGTGRVRGTAAMSVGLPPPNESTCRRG